MRSSNDSFLPGFQFFNELLLKDSLGSFRSSIPQQRKLSQVCKYSSDYPYTLMQVYFLLPKVVPYTVPYAIVRSKAHHWSYDNTVHL